MTKQSDHDPDDVPPEPARVAEPEQTPTFDRLRELQARFDMFNMSSVSQALNQIQERQRHFRSILNSPVSQAMREMQERQRHFLSILNSPLSQAMREMRAPFDSPLFAAIKAARIWSDSMSDVQRTARLSRLESLKIFQSAAEEAAAMARVDVSELATAVDASLGSFALAGTSGAASPSRLAPSPSRFEDTWNTLPFVVKVFLFLLWNLLIIPIYNVCVEQWVKASAKSQPKIVRSVKQDLGPDLSRNLRCVRGSGVNICENPIKSARIIGRLGRSQAVAVIETEGSFSRIRYFDAGSREIREGWAASSYLVGAAC